MKTATNQAAEINRLHDLLNAQARTTIETAIKIGSLLEKQKAELPHCQWIPWCKANLAFGHSSVTKYLRIFRNRDKLPAAGNLGVDMADRILSPGPRVLENSGNNEWHSPGDIVESARDAMGGIDLDPASNDIANQTIRARQYYCKAENGLVKKWQGRLWLNPPYSQPDISQFIEKLVAEVKTGTVASAVVLVNNATETKWFQTLAGISSAACLLSYRVKFSSPDSKPSNPLQGQVVFYIGENVREFAKHFAAHGAIFQPLKA
jgi:phage N-6-adenine-methyltransferase